MRDEGGAVPETKKTIEQWATEKELLPQMFAPKTPQQSFAGEHDPRAGRTVHRVTLARVQGLVRRNNPNYWKFAAAKAHEQAHGRWYTNSMVTEAEFDKVIELVTHGQTQR
jgi:hypothetical protein